MQFLAHSVVWLNVEIMEVAEFPGGRVLQRKKRQSINGTDSKEAEPGSRRDNNEGSQLLHSVYPEIPPGHLEDIGVHEMWNRALSPF